MDVSVFCFLASYLCAFGLECRRLYHRTGLTRACVLLFAAAGLVAHTLYLWNRHAQTGLPPLMSSTHDWVLVLAWMAILVYLFLLVADRQLAIGVFLLPLVLALVGLAYLVSREPTQIVRDTPEMREVAGRAWAMLHATLLVFGIAAAIFGLVLSLMYLVQHHRLRHKHARNEGLILPNLERLARLNNWAVVLSVPLLTLGLLTGVVLGWLARKGSESLSFSDPVVVGSAVAWLVLVAFFVWFAGTPARRTSGRQVAWLTVMAFGFLLVTLIGLQVLTGHLGNSWHAATEGGWSRSHEEASTLAEARAGGRIDVIARPAMPQLAQREARRS
ncbi:MAG TPA: cytochrome c biogenesis protein CcsA [Planctomycetaceae bacterium]|nr:cytochrome c biogenesis protein CcsA [Planctomycetaceae bacterium]